jgi:hypothetical protein
MKRPTKQREHRVGSGFKPEVLDSALLHLEQRTLLPQSQLEAEAHPVAESSVAKERVKAAQDAYKADPSDANRQELNNAHKDLRTSLEVELTTMDPSKAFQVSKQKALSLRAKADDVMKLIRNTKLERNEAQMRADGMGVIRVDQKRAKLEAQYAVLVDEMRFYQTMMGAVYKRNDFSEYGSEAHRKKASLSLRATNAERRGDTGLVARLREKRLALELNDASVVAKSARSNNDRVVKNDRARRSKRSDAQAAQSLLMTGPAARNDGDKAPNKGTQAKSKGAGETRSEKLGSFDRWGMTQAEQLRYVELLMKNEARKDVP